MYLIHGHAKFQPCSAKKTFSNSRINKRGAGNLVENWPYVGNGEIYGQGYY